MSMTKKDFEAISSIIKHEAEVAKAILVDGGDEQDVRSRVGVLRVVAHRIADHCKTRNKSFDPRRFLKACGIA
jgi:hypothetical protein